MKTPEDDMDIDTPHGEKRWGHVRMCLENHEELVDRLRTLAALVVQASVRERALPHAVDAAADAIKFINKLEKR